MTFLLEKRGAAVAALVALLGAAALFLGAGGAHADTCSTTDGSPGDATVNVPGVVAADVSNGPLGTGLWACAVPPGQGAGFVVNDADPGTVGYQVESSTGGSLGDHYIVDDTGAEAELPTGTPNEPGGGDGTGSVVKYPGNCLYVDGASDCEPNADLVTVTVAEGDLPQVETAPGCVNVNGTCQAPTVDGARVTVFGDTANETVYVDSRFGVGASDEHLPTCVGVDYGCP